MKFNMRILKHYLLFGVSICLCAMVCQAEERSAEEWIELALEDGLASLKNRDSESKLDALYEYPELSYRLIAYDARLGNKERCKETFKLLAVTVGLIYGSEGEEDLWPRIYLPGPAHAVGHEIDIQMPDDALNQAFIHQILAETHYILGEQKAYQEACEKLFSLLKKAEDAEIAFAADEEFEYTGGILSWHTLAMCRDFQDIANARKFAAYSWYDPCEKSGALSILAQLEWVAGNQQKALELTAQAIMLMKKGVTRSRQERNELKRDVPADELAFEIYYPELGNSLPELYAAIHLTKGAEEAEKTAGMLAFEDTAWRSPAYVHTATALRRAGKKEGAREMVVKGMEVLFKNEELPGAYDTMHLSRELVLQNRLDLVERLYKENDNYVFKAYVALGAVQAKLAE